MLRWNDEPVCARCGGSRYIDMAEHHPDCKDERSCARLCPVQEQRPCPECVPRAYVSRDAPLVEIDEDELPF